jgi:hypothetical protein
MYIISIYFSTARYKMNNLERRHAVQAQRQDKRPAYQAKPPAGITKQFTHKHLQPTRRYYLSVVYAYL